MARRNSGPRFHVYEDRMRPVARKPPKKDPRPRGPKIYKPVADCHSDSEVYSAYSHNLDKDW